MRKSILETLHSHPHFTKGDIIHYLNLPTDKETLTFISKVIWCYNYSVGRKGYYSLTTTN